MAKQATQPTATTAPAKQQAAKVRHTISAARTVAATANAKGVVPGNKALHATGATAGRQQKLRYSYDDTSVKLVASAAKGSQQQAYLATLQAAFGKAKTMQASAVLAALQNAGVANPKRVMRRAYRAGVLVG